MSDNLVMGLEISRRLKQQNPQLKILFGGPGVSFCAKEILTRYPFVDFILRGECDQVFPEFLTQLRQQNTHSSIAGLVYRQNSDIIDNGWPTPIKNLDDLPIPAFDFCDHELTAKNYGDYNGVSIEAGRGCPFNCSYCTTSIFFHRNHRLKSVERIIREIEYVRTHLGDRRIIFHHDLLTLRHDFVYALCRQIKEKFPGLIWKCHVRLNTIHHDLLKAMRESGCNEIFMGIESATDRMQKVIRKRMDLSNFEEIARSLYQLKIRGHFSFIVGFPEETNTDLKANLIFALKAMQLAKEFAVIKIHTLVPSLGSDLYQKTREQLTYDEYGSYGSTEIPPNWSGIRNEIASQPDLFSMFHYVDIGAKKRENSWKISLLGLAIGKLMPISMRLAYLALGEKLADLLLASLDQLPLPPAAVMQNFNYWIFTEALIDLLQTALSDHPVVQKKFEAVARFEHAKIKVEHHPQEGYYEVIQTHFSPADVAREVMENKFQVTEQAGTFCYMIFRDPNSGKIKNRPLQPEFIQLLGTPNPQQVQINH